MHDLSTWQEPVRQSPHPTVGHTSPYKSSNIFLRNVPPTTQMTTSYQPIHFLSQKSILQGRNIFLWELGRSNLQAGKPHMICTGLHSSKPLISVMKGLISDDRRPLTGARFYAAVKVLKGDIVAKPFHLWPAQITSTMWTPGIFQCIVRISGESPISSTSTERLPPGDYVITTDKWPTSKPSHYNTGYNPRTMSYFEWSNLKGQEEVVQVSARAQI